MNEPAGSGAAPARAGDNRPAANDDGRRGALSMRQLRGFFVVVDVGFLAYWAMAWMHLFPRDLLFKDYENPILDAWNFSFLPLDLMVSASGLGSIALHRRGMRWEPLAAVSLTLTFCSGLQAVAFWFLRRDFDPVWWIPNLFLLLYPLFFLGPMLARNGHGARDARTSPTRP